MSTETNERRGATSASNAEADSLCAGRHQAQAGMPDTNNPDAEFGTQIHNALSSGDSSKLNTQQLSIYDSCVEISQRLLNEAFGPQVKEAKVFREQRLWAKIPYAAGIPSDKVTEPSWGVHYDHSAKADLIARIGAKGIIIEFKCLVGDVPESPKNMQLRDQAVIAARSLLITDIAVAVVQPLVTHKPEVTVYEPADIEQAEKDMWARVIASNQPNAKRTAGDAQCKFCKAKTKCPEYAAWTKSILPAPVALFDVAVGLWTPEQCATFLERKSIASKWLDECFDALKERLKADPKCIPGWGLEEGDTRTKVTNVNELHARFLASGGTTDNFLKCVSVVKKELQTQVRSATQLKGKGLAAKIDELLQGIVEEKQNEPSIGRVK